MTVKELADLILKRHYGSIVDDKKVTPRQVILHIQTFRDSKIKIDLFREMDMGENNPSPDFFKELYLAIKWDDRQDRAYVEFPSPVASLPHDKGIGPVRFPKERRGFVRIPKGASSMIPELAAHAEGNYPWELVTSKKMYLHNLGSEWVGKEIYVSAITTGDLTETESTYMPSAYEAEAIEYIVNLLKGSRPADTVNDNRDEPG